MNRHLEAVPRCRAYWHRPAMSACRPANGGRGIISRGGFTHGMTKGERHGDVGLDIGRKTMQPVYDFHRQGANATENRFLSGTRR